MKIAVGSDHGGYELKEALKAKLKQRRISVEDFGAHSEAAVDYSDFARDVARKVAAGQIEQGILVCKTGIGMSISANKVPGVRAALCMTPQMAVKAREHNNANILVLAGAYTDKTQADAILTAWLDTPYTAEARHQRRIDKVARLEFEEMEAGAMAATDPELFAAVCCEVERQAETINLIASENYTSKAVREAQGSVLTNKYAEGYPGKRWYNGCDCVDRAEKLAIDRACQLFGAEHANVQPHCGSSANMAVYFAMLNPGDTILAMSLAHGGHLTHGHPANFSGRLFHVASYGVQAGSEQIDYAAVAAQAEECKPRLIVVGASAYPRLIDFKAFREIADRVGAYLMVDMAHIAGLVAAGCHPSPVPFADFVTATTHKTLRGPRSGLILCRQKYAADIDKQIFPGIQGGPLMHTIAAKAVCFKEAMNPAFRDYAHQIVRNARALAEVLNAAGCRLVSGGTDNHLMLVDLTPMNVTGRDAAAALDQAGIIVNKNAIPFDTRSPMVTSGIRIGTPAVTSRGMKEEEMRLLAGFILDVLRDPANLDVIHRTREKTAALTASFPVRI